MLVLSTINHSPFTKRGFKLLTIKLTEAPRSGERRSSNNNRRARGENWRNSGSGLKRLKPLADAYGLTFGHISLIQRRLKIAENVVAEVGLTKRSSVRPITELGHIAEFVRRDPGPPGRGRKSLFNTSNQGTRENMLIKRSFHDCDHVYLESLSGGRASLNVFSVHAWLQKIGSGSAANAIIYQDCDHRI